MITLDDLSTIADQHPDDEPLQEILALAAIAIRLHDGFRQAPDAVRDYLTDKGMEPRLASWFSHERLGRAAHHSAFLHALVHAGVPAQLALAEMQKREAALMRDLQKACELQTGPFVIRMHADSSEGLKGTFVFKGADERIAGYCGCTMKYVDGRCPRCEPVFSDG